VRLAKGDARTRGLFQRGARTVSERVLVFARPGQAERTLRSVRSFGHRRCRARLFARNFARVDGVTDVETPRTARIRIPSLGDGRTADRMRVRFTYRGQRFGAVADFAYVRVGRGIARLAFANVNARFGNGLRNQLLEIVESRLDNALPS
jgi:hypothetical protein